MAVVFISYRRADSEDVTGRIYDELVKRFDRTDIFMDVDSIPDGEDFTKIIHDQVNACQVMLVIVGPNWAGRLATQKKRRIDDPNDFVRLEVEAALQRGMPIIPLLVSRAEMPKPAELPESLRRLSQLNARAVRARDFHRDMEKVILAIEFQQANWIEMERERERRRENAALALKQGTTGADTASARSSSDASSLSRLIGLAGRHVMRAVMRMVSRVIVWAVIGGLLAAGGAIGVAGWLTHRFPPDIPTYVAAAALALSTGGFIGAVTALAELIRAIRVTIELIVEEAEKLASDSVLAAQVMPLPANLPAADNHDGAAPSQSEPGVLNNPSSN